MKKWEELRAQLLWIDRKSLTDDYGRVYGHQEVAHIPTVEEVDSLIAAAREEGAEQERERIRKESLHYAEGEPLEGTDAESVEGDEAIAQQEMFIIPASVLAPAPKENP